jgi:hypothetical protein
MKTAINTKIIPNKSLIIKYGINGIKSDLFIIPVGLFDPYSCKNAI